MGRRLVVFGIFFPVLALTVGLLLYADHFRNGKMYDQMIEVVKGAVAVILGAGANELAR
jgi:chromate transport protein ChrA